MAHNDFLEDSKSYRLLEVLFHYAAVNVSFLFLRRHMRFFLKQSKAAFYNSGSKRLFTFTLKACADNPGYFIAFSLISILISHFLLSLLNHSMMNFFAVMVVPVIFYLIWMKKNGLAGFMSAAYKNSLISRILNKKV